jgi:hypothetical protein
MTVLWYVCITLRGGDGTGPGMSCQAGVASVTKS